MEHATENLTDVDDLDWEVQCESLACPLGRLDLPHAADWIVLGSCACHYHWGQARIHMIGNPPEGQKLSCQRCKVEGVTVIAQHPIRIRF